MRRAAVVLVVSVLGGGADVLAGVECVVDVAVAVVAVVVVVVFVVLFAGVHLIGGYVDDAELLQRTAETWHHLPVQGNPSPTHTKTRCPWPAVQKVWPPLN